VLLNVFDVYRLPSPGEHVDEYGGYRSYWFRQRWWYKLAHVCQRWRHLILASPSRLDLHLYCAPGVPVADMLAHSPPLPLIIYYHRNYDQPKITARDQSDILLALSHRDRVRRISFMLSASNLGRSIMAMGGKFPILERMFIDSLEPRATLAFPLSFQAPNLRHLGLWLAVSLLTGSPSLTTTAGLVSLRLGDDPPSIQFPPSHILTWLSIMPRLESLEVAFYYHLPHRYVERESAHTPNITLSKLHEFIFVGTSEYLEGLVSRISAPSLCTIRLHLSDQLTFTTLSLLRFMKKSQYLNFNAVKLVFDRNFIEFNLSSSSKVSVLELRMMYGHLGLQVPCALQILTTFSSALSVVEQVMLGYRTFGPSVLPNTIDRAQWREVLRPFGNAKILFVQKGLVTEISRSLQSDDGELPLGILPNLKEVGYSGESYAQDALTGFVDERQEAGHPVKLTMVKDSLFYKLEWM
jgi:hypothetical protein